MINWFLLFFLLLVSVISIVSSILSEKLITDLKEENKLLKEKKESVEKENTFLMMELYRHVKGFEMKGKEEE